MIRGRRFVIHGGSRLPHAFLRLSFTGAFTSGFAVAVQLLSYCGGSQYGRWRWRPDVNLVGVCPLKISIEGPSGGQGAGMRRTLARCRYYEIKKVHLSFPTLPLFVAQLHWHAVPFPCMVLFPVTNRGQQ